MRPLLLKHTSTMQRGVRVDSAEELHAVSSGALQRPKALPLAPRPPPAPRAAEPRQRIVLARADSASAAAGAAPRDAPAAAPQGPVR